MQNRPFTWIAAAAFCASCGGAATSDSNGLVLVTPAPLVCVDSSGNPVPGGTCGEDSQCRDELGFVIEGTMCVEEGTPDDGDSDSDSDSADTEGDSDSDSDHDTDHDSDSAGAGHGDHDSDGDSDSDHDTDHH